MYLRHLGYNLNAKQLKEYMKGYNNIGTRVVFKEKIMYNRRDAIKLERAMKGKYKIEAYLVDAVVIGKGNPIFMDNLVLNDSDLMTCYKLSVWTRCEKIFDGAVESYNWTDDVKYVLQEGDNFYLVQNEIDKDINFNSVLHAEYKFI